MDIVEIGVAKGDTVNFLDLVHPSMKEKCERYVQKAGGPTTMFKERGEKTPLEYLTEAFAPLQKYKNKIGMVIDGSTTRGFTEPQQSALYAQHLGIKSPMCFDVIEACNGWARAAETAYMNFELNKSLSDKYILIINNEQPPETRAVLPTDITDYKAVASYYVGLTFSNVTTCTILKKSQNYTWNFQHHTDPQFASHIAIALPQVAKGYLPKHPDYDVYLYDNYGQFCIPRMHQVDKKTIFILGNIEGRPELFKESNVICHTFSKKLYEIMFANSDLGKLSLYYNESGNLGSCSFPYILHDQYGPNLKTGEKLCFCGNAAGGSDFIITFEHNAVSEKRQDDQALGKYQLMMKMGWRILMTKLGCKKKNKLVSTTGSKSKPKTN